MSTQQPDLDPVRRHFDREAGEYDSRSEGPLWQLLRRREARALWSMLRPQPGEHILDAGSGAGFYTRLLIEADCRVTACDLSAPMLGALRRRHPAVETLEGNLETMSLPPVFDRILCAGAFEFIPRPELAIANLAGALRPGGAGLIVLMMPGDGLAARIYRRFHRGHGFSVHLFSRARVEALAAASGLAVEKTGMVTFNRIAALRRNSGLTGGPS